MSGIKLTYFNARGRAEPARLMLAQAGLAYEDERVTNYWEDSGDWERLKPSVPFGRLPVLSWRGTAVGQSGAINRFLARELGLAGGTSLQAAQVDEVVDTIQDLVEAVFDINHEEDAGRKQVLAVRYREEAVPEGLGMLETRLAGSSHFVGGQLSLADIMAYFYCTEYVDRGVLDKYPGLERLTRMVADLPNIKCWVENRPKTKH